ncbi:MAG: MATE family efflux transporter [Clostridia bacterium]|nr:MATE family efflux transporter [Clostridia bacterium]
METTQNKMGVMPVGKLLITMSLPMILSMLVQALYNIVDSYFVSMVSIESLTAVGQAFSAQNLMIGIATGTAVGVGALFSRALGSGDTARAATVAHNGVFLALCGFAVIFLFGLFGTKIYYDGILSAAKLDDGLDLALLCTEGERYLRICTLLSLFVFMHIMFERLMQSTGRTHFTLLTQGIGALCNIVLDPIFILPRVPLLGLPGLDLGAAGAAYATVIGQAVAAVIAIFCNQKFNPEARISFGKIFHPSAKTVGEIYAIGVPSIIMVSVGSVMYYFVNMILMRVSAFGASVYGVYFKLQSFVFMPLFGMNNGVIPIVAYNYGAGNRRRMLRTVKLALLFAEGVMLFGMAVLWLFPAQLLSLFIADAAVIAIGVVAMRIISLSFLFAGVCIALISVFQALGYGAYSMLVSIARQLIVLLPVAYLLSLTGNIDNIWWAYPIAEVASLAVTLLLYLHLHKTVISKIPLDSTTNDKERLQNETNCSL